MSAKIENQLLTTTNNDESSKDEVDFIRTKTYPPPSTNINNNIKDLTINSTITSPTKLQCPLLMKKLTPGTLYGDCEVKTSIKSSLSTLEKFTFFTLHRRHNSQNSINNNNNININNNNNNNSKLNNSLIKSNELTTNPSSITIKESPKNKFVKSASIARLLGNTYNTKKIENELLKLKYNQNNINNNNNNINSDIQNINNNNNNNNKSLISDKNYGVRRRNLCSSQNINNNINNGGIRNERFQKCSKLEDEFSSNNYNLNNNNFNNNNNSNTNNCEINIQDFHDDHTNDISAKAFRTISRSLGKLWWKRTHSIEISQPDPEFKVSYLGNVLTGWAKGDGCIEKPISTLWRNYTQNHKPDVVMRIKICASGLKATTRQHGLTEYWANRITYCCSPKNYSRVFCWIYRHEGRKLKHELRCHAVLCSKESIAQDICNMLRENLDRALADFKREKILKQNARLSLANSVYENPSLPRRKILLSVGGNNYRPPMERSKSAPKLMAIEEAIGEEDGEDIEQTNEPEMAACCQKDSLYPAMTLGRRRCRRGHSIRRTGKPYKSFCGGSNCISAATALKTTIEKCTTNSSSSGSSSDKRAEEINITTKSNSSLAGSDEDDFDKLLSNNNYDTTSPLAGELLSYFDMKMHNGKTSSLTNLNEHDEHIDIIDRYDLYEPSLTTDPSPRPCTLSLDNLDNCSDLECGDDCMTTDEYDDDDHDIYDKDDQLFYHQSAIMNILHRNSLRKMANLSMSSDDSNSIDLIKDTNQINDDNQRRQQRCSSSDNNDTDDLLIQPQQQKQQLQHLDSDEGSISSGCETASTVTTNLEESSLKYLCNQDEQSVEDDNQIDLNRENQQIIREKLNGGLVMPSFDSVNQRYLNAIKNLNENNTNNNNIDDGDIKISSNTLSLQQLPKPSIRRRLSGCIRNENSLNLNENSEKSIVENMKRNKSGGECGDGSGGEVSDSEFSDESGYVEYQDQFGSQQSKNNTIKRLIT